MAQPQENQPEGATNKGGGWWLYLGLDGPKHDSEGNYWFRMFQNTFSENLFHVLGYQQG